MILRGKVTSGENNASYWINRLDDLYTLKTGMKLYPGTLNIELPEQFILASNVIRLEKEEHGGHVSVSILPCFIFQRKAFIIRTDTDDRLNTIEIATDVKLRETYNLVDGDIAEVKIDVQNNHSSHY